MRRAVSWGSKAIEAVALVTACVGTLFMACAGAIFTAPPNSTITVLPAPGTIVVPANGGSTDILAIVTEPAGTFVADGTEVLFFASIGTIDRKVRTRDGVARARFVSDSRSGLAEITVISGGTAPAPVAPPSGSPGTGGSSGGSGSGTGSGRTQIVVGNAAVANIRLTAEPPQLLNNRASLITANVFDIDGNPVPNALVFFTLSQSLTEFLESGGRPQFTDNNGRAFDVLRSRFARGDAPARTVTVTASVPGRSGFEMDTVMVVVD